MWNKPWDWNPFDFPLSAPPSVSGVCRSWNTIFVCLLSALVWFCAPAGKHSSNQHRFPAGERRHILDSAQDLAFQWVQMFCFRLEDWYVLIGQRTVIRQGVWEVICLDTTMEPPIRPRGWSSPCELPLIAWTTVHLKFGVSSSPSPNPSCSNMELLLSLWKTGNFQGKRRITSGHGMRLHQIIGWDCTRVVERQHWSLLSGDQW